MFLFFKYTVYLLILLSFIIFYFLFTPLGHTNIYHFISKKLSQKNDMLIEVQSINILQYPQNIRIVLYIEKKAKLTLRGYLDDAKVDMHYTLTSQCIASNYCKVDDNVDIKGYIKGPFTKLFITGKGQALDGNIRYHALKYTDKVTDFKLHMHDINASKLANLLGQEALIKGKADAKVNFSLMNEKEKYGTILYDVEDKNFHGIDLKLHSNININNNQHTFSIEAYSDELHLTINKGLYNQTKKQAHASYLLDIKNLQNLEDLLGYKYHGSFLAQGTLSYANTINITGTSKSFGGLTHFTLDNTLLDIKMHQVSLEKIMNLLSFPSLLEAQTNGIMQYDFKHETLKVHSTLNHARFLPSRLVDVVKKKAHVQMRNEIFQNSKLDLSYHHHTILGNIKLTNTHSHVYLTHTNIQTQHNTIDAYFDLKMQAQEFSGKIYGSLHSPKVNLDLQKLVRYQMDKQVDKMIGKDGRKIMEHMPMGGVAKDMATDMGASFMKVFF
jgi:hypothetical protein